MAADFFDACFENEGKDEEARYYVWTDSLSCGNGDIDADHRHIFDLAERLRTADMQGQGDTVVGNFLVELMEYIQGHFSREEALMRAVGYPALADHQFEHSLFMTRVHLLHRNFIEGRRVSFKEIWQFLRRWLRYHIMNADTQMAQYVTKANPVRRM